MNITSFVSNYVWYIFFSVWKYNLYPMGTVNMCVKSRVHVMLLNDRQINEKKKNWITIRIFDGVVIRAAVY